MLLTRVLQPTTRRLKANSGWGDWLPLCPPFHCRFPRGFWHRFAYRWATSPSVSVSLHCFLGVDPPRLSPPTLPNGGPVAGGPCSSRRAHHHSCSSILFLSTKDTMPRYACCSPARTAKSDLLVAGNCVDPSWCEWRARLSLWCPYA